MSRTRSLWWAAASLVVIEIGSFAPWARAVGSRIDGTNDEIVAALSLVAGIALVVFAVTRDRKLITVPLLAGLISVALIAHDIKDPAGPFGGPGPNFLNDHDPAGPFGGPGPNVRLEWGIWLALAGAVALLLTSILLRIEIGRGAAQPRSFALPRGRRSSLLVKTRLAALGDDALVSEVATRLNRSKTSAVLIARLAERVHAKEAGQLVEGLTHVRELDYSRHSIKLVVSSAAIAKRLGSVEKEPFTVEWIEQSLKAGDVFFDIGANVGPYSLIAAKFTEGRAKVFAFEPAASSYSDLARNVALNDCTQSVIPVPIALWSKTGLLSMRLRSLEAGAARHRLGGDLSQVGPHTRSVLGVRLDDLVDRFGVPVPTHAKIDVDGYELEVLRGAERTLARPEWQSIIIELEREETEGNQVIKSLLAHNQALCAQSRCGIRGYSGAEAWTRRPSHPPPGYDEHRPYST